MISIFLPAFPFRGVKAPYLWFFYRLLSSAKESVHFIMGKEYQTSISDWQNDGRWEMTNDGQKRLGYQVPDLSLLDTHKVSIVDESFLKDYLKQYFNNPNTLFEKFITEPIPELVAALDIILAQHDDIECILTWCNCPSLNLAASKKNIRVVNMELGPLRELEYLATGYFDFRGVNGNTEAEQRYLEATSSEICFSEGINLAQLRDFFAHGAQPGTSTGEYDVGIVLQVENDSNILAYSNSFSNQSLLDYAEYSQLGRTLIRSHPGSRFTVRAETSTIDHSQNSIEFISRCKKILTINSSVGLEAMLMDVEVVILGDCSYSFCNVEDRIERINRLSFYLFAYLVPFDLLFDVNYVRFRLSEHSENEIIKKHVEYYITHGEGLYDLENKINISTLIKSVISIRKAEKDRLRLEREKIEHIEDGVSTEHIEDGVLAEHIEDGVSTEHIEDGVSTEHIEDGEPAKHIEDSVSAEHIEEDVPAERIEDGLSAEHLEDGVSESKVEGGFQVVKRKITECIVDVVVPVYAGLQETQECIESALATLPQWAELIVINDSSPEPELTNWLRDRSHSGDFTLLENENNLGFVATVNRGMMLNLKRDVLLLNSDVEVANDWLERIREAAYSRDRVGSITPFSNNATICSFPNFCEDNELFLGMNVQQLDDQFATYGHKNNLVEVPTGVGFCMYIRRDCLNEVGYFDVETFGRGYGEENDWCQRATKAGWPNFHQLNVFVYHKGGVSFAGEQNPRKTRALELLNELHPNYTKDVMDFIAQDPAKRARQQLLLRILAKKDISKVLLVSHKMGGGVTQHLSELASFYKEKIHFLLLTPEVEGVSVSLSLNTDNFICREKFVIDISQGYDDLINLLRFLGVGHIHFHHLMGIPDLILGLNNSLSCTYDITIHDYYFINANPTLTDKNGIFASDDFVIRDKLCSQHYPIPEDMSAVLWREKLLPFFDSAERLIFPSADTQVRFIHEFPDYAHKSIIAWHPDFEVNAPYPEVDGTYQAGEKLKVLVLGALSREKGALMLEEVANELKHEDIEFHLLGYAFRSLEGVVKCHGPYSNSDIQHKLDLIKPNVIWYPAQWPETYSYTLSIALEQGIPVVVPNIGAFRERVSGRRYSRVIAWNISVDKMCKLFRSLRNDPTAFFNATNEPEQLDIFHAQRVEGFYQYNYLQANWLRESELGRIDYKEFIDSMYTSINVKVVPVTPAMPQGRKEKLFVILWNLSQHPALAWGTKLIPYRLQRYVKRLLSRRAIHEIIG